MVGHNQTMEWLVMQHLDHQLPERHRHDVEAHLSACPRCREYAATARAASRWLQESAAGPARADVVWDAVRSRLAAIPTAQSGRGSWRAWVRPWNWGWVAVGSVAAVLFLMWLNPLTRLSGTTSHEAYVAFVEAADYPVMVITPAQRHEMTVIWIFEPVEEPLPSPTT